jgi:hypothetical protein
MSSRLTKLARLPRHSHAELPRRVICLGQRSPRLLTEHLARVDFIVLQAVAGAHAARFDRCNVVVGDLGVRAGVLGSVPADGDLNDYN